MTSLKKIRIAQSVVTDKLTKSQYQAYPDKHIKNSVNLEVHVFNLTSHVLNQFQGAINHNLLHEKVG